MLELRPIVANRDGVILGGNQRFKACLQAGFDYVWCIWADEITDEEAKRFILRDNIDFGKWDLEIMARHYNQEELLKYGSEIILLDRQNPREESHLDQDDDMEPDLDEEEIEESKKNFNEGSIKQIVFFLPDELYEDAVKTMDKISKKIGLEDNTEVLLHLINFYELNHD